VGKPRQPSDRGPGAVFVGRDRELAELRAGLQDAAAGRGRLFLVVGEAGIGKTRLAEELAREAAKTAATVLWGRCWDGEGAPPYWPWTQALRGLLRVTEAQGVPTALGAGAAYLAHLVPELRTRVPGLQPLTASHVEEHARFYLFDAATTFLKRAAAVSPLVLVFDDLQWADTSSLLLLHFLSHELRNTRILVIATYRDADVRLAPAVATILGGLVGDGNHLPLEGLTEAEVARFIERTAGRAGHPALVRAVHRETDGNPFFVDEVVRLLAASGGFQHPDHSRAGRLPVPHGVRAAIARRLARVPAPCREVLVMASVIGSEFDVACLAQAGGMTAEHLMEALGRALAHEIIAEVRGAPNVYRFSHALVREALYQDLAPGERVKLHRQIGEALETLYRGHPEAHLAELAHHFVQARPGGDARKAVDYAVRAARRAAASLAYDEAAALYRRALEAHESTADERQRCEMLLALGDVQWRTEDGSDLRETFRQAAELARRVGDTTLLAQSALGLAGESSGRLWVESGAVDWSLVSLLEEAPTSSATVTPPFARDCSRASPCSSTTLRRASEACT
jgi:predicted ATPase